MDVLVIIALVVATLLCLSPGIMAWSHYFGGGKQTVKKRKPVSTTRPVTTGHAH